ncbi:hypothetical protein CRM22_009997 [Opisthorchis felineus]|uniref:Uncharacterized protein n=1 Tax=Opisthorchis felineus TaxID=147828 RepID=A0A4S2L9E3_OPIFE|nr:hypothetical protein CRM22_009997 [Opisthorchis felineus]
MHKYNSSVHQMVPNYPNGIKQLLEPLNCFPNIISSYLATTGITTTTPTTTTRITTTTTTANLPTPSPELYDEEESDDEETLNPGELSPAEKLGQILSAGDVNKLCEAVQPFKNYEMNSQCYNKTGSCSFQGLKYQFPLPKINAFTQWNNSTAAEYIKGWLQQNNLSHHIPAICVDDIINRASCDTTAVGYFYFHVHQAVNIFIKIVEIMNVLPMPPKSYCMKLSIPASHYRQLTACDYPLPLKAVKMNSQCYNKTGSCSFQSLKYQFPLPKINASTQWNNSTAAEYVKAWLKQNDLSHHIPAICVDDIINTTSCGTTAVGYFYFHVHQAVNISTRIVEIMNVLLVPPKSYCTKLTTAAFHYRQVMACDYPLPLKIITVTRNEASSTSVFAGVVGVSLVVMLCDFMRTFLV